MKRWLLRGDDRDPVRYRGRSEALVIGVRSDDSSAQEVWTVFAHRFDDAYKWMASVPKSYGKENGTLFDGASSAGRVCQLQPDPSGLKALRTVPRLRRAHQAVHRAD